MIFQDDREKFKYLIQYLEVLTKLPTNGPLNNTIYKIRKEIEDMLHLSEVEEK